MAAIVWETLPTWDTTPVYQPTRNLNDASHPTYTIHSISVLLPSDTKGIGMVKIHLATHTPQCLVGMTFDGSRVSPNTQPQCPDGSILKSEGNCVTSTPEFCTNTVLLGGIYCRRPYGNKHFNDEHYKPTLHRPVQSNTIASAANV
ncbi:hypothetical protein BBP40_006998 [Aspergillus hancockii]|nr:hypothetical protein BBP40_006998 [Aspergillus hancockii]